MKYINTDMWIYLDYFYMRNMDFFKASDCQ